MAPFLKCAGNVKGRAQVDIVGLHLQIQVITVIRRALCVRIISNVILLENYKY